MIGFIALFIVVFIIVLAFKKDRSVTTVVRKDENGNEVTEARITEHHSAGQTAARIAIGIFLALVVLAMLVICAAAM